MAGRAGDLKSKGNVYFRDQQYERAKKCYLDALKAGMEEGADDMHTIYGNLAHVCNKLNTFKESEKYARLAIRRKPDWFKGYHRAALAAKNLGKLDDAIALLDKGIDNCVINDDLKILRDNIVEQKRRPKGASKPPPPPPLLKADQQPTASSDTRTGSKTKATKASKASKSSTAAPAAAAAAADWGVWTGLLSSAKPAETVSEQTAAAARAGQPDALSEELCITVRRGSVALQRPGGAREAYDEYRRALQQVAKHPKELNLSGNELISLRYCFAMACHEVATLESLNSAEEELLAIIQKTKRPMPAAFYLLGMVYMRLNRFEQAATVLQMADDILSKDARGDTHVYPGTSEVIPDTERAWRGTLRQPVQELARQCQYPPRADALCRLDDCLSRVTVPDIRNPNKTRQQPRKAIYYRDVDFAGFIQVQCLSKCRLEYHLACWRQLKERFGSETQRTTDKDLLNTPCRTPDCDSSICRIVTIDANGLEKHEILSGDYKKQQQKQPQKQLSKQQKKQAAQAQKKHQLLKSRKHKDSLPQPSEDGDTQRQPGESSAPAAGPSSEPAAAAAGAAAGAEQEPAPPPDLREMTVLRRGSATEEVPVGKKSKKKTKKGSSSRVRGRRAATEMFWETPGTEEEVYNGPPVNVIYNTSPEDLAVRLCQLEDLRTLQFSTRALIPDSSVQPASVPRDDQSGEEAHAILESAYQFLYDYLKERGPTSVADPELLSMVSELPGPCQELIAQYGSLESFLTRLPRFYQLDDLLSVEVDVPTAEAMLGSVISGHVQVSVTTPSPVRPPPPVEEGAVGGLSDADTAELEPQSDPDDSDLGESESESEEEEEEGVVGDSGASVQNGASHSEERTADASEPEPEPDSDLADPNSVELDGDSAEPDVDSPGLDVDSVADADAGEQLGPVEGSDRTGADADGAAADGGGAGPRGDGAWNTDPEASDGGEDSPGQLESSDDVRPRTTTQLLQLIETLKREKREQAEQLSEARICQLRLERTVRQMAQRTGPAQGGGGAAEPADTAQQQQQQQQLVDTRQRLAEAQGRLTAADQQRTDALQRAAELQRQLNTTGQQLLSTQQQLAGSQQQLMVTQQEVAAYQQQQQQYELQLADAEQQLLGSQQLNAQLQQQAEELASQLSQPAAPDPEQLRQLEEQTESRRLAETELDQLRSSERRTRVHYVSMLSRAGTVILDGVSSRCSDAVSGAQRLAATSGRPDSALPTVTKLQEATAALEQTRTQFKETIKKACKAISSKETIDIQSLKLPEIPDIVETALTGPSGGRPSRSSPAGSVRSAGASPRPSSRPSSAVTVSSGSGSETGRVSPSPTPPPPAAPAAAAAALKAPTPRRAVTPAALQLSAASRQAAPTTFDALVSEIEQQFGGAVPGGRDAILRQFTSYRRRRGGALRGAARDQIVTEITAMIRAAAAADSAVPAAATTATTAATATGPDTASATATGAWARPNGTANGGGAEAAAPPTLSSVPSKEECVVCRESLTSSQARRLECGHQFHELCVRRWLRANGVMATCPICRHPFTSETDFPSL